MNETLKTIHNLRTIHGNFSSKDITDEDLKKILKASVRAANASARQSYSIVVVENREVMQKLSGFQGSRTLIFCVDYNRIIETAKVLNQSFSSDGVVPFITGGIDTILAAQTAAIAARSLGIDCLFTNGIHRGDITRIYTLLNLPEKYCFPMIALILGYPAEEPEHQKGRWSGAGLVHYNTYHPATNEELEGLIRYYDDPTKNMWLNDNWKQKGFDHYLDWFFEVWSKQTASIGGKEKVKSQMAEILEKIGFAE